MRLNCLKILKNKISLKMIGTVESTCGFWKSNRFCLQNFQKDPRCSTERHRDTWAPEVVNDSDLKQNRPLKWTWFQCANIWGQWMAGSGLKTLSFSWPRGFQFHPRNSSYFMNFATKKTAVNMLIGSGMNCRYLWADHTRAFTPFLSWIIFKPLRTAFPILPGASAAAAVVCSVRSFTACIWCISYYLRFHLPTISKGISKQGGLRFWWPALRQSIRNDVPAATAPMLQTDQYMWEQQCFLMFKPNSRMLKMKGNK